MNYKRARERMVREQIIRRGITDNRVLEAMSKVPRHRFVDESLRDRAYGDYPLPIGEGQTISQPFMVALMTQSLNLLGHERVLEIGTGSGYQTAVLAEIVPHVFSVERVGLLARRARKLLDDLGYDRVAIKIFDGTYGWSEHAPFDGIIVTAASPGVPESLTGQLADGGRLVIPVGAAYSQSLLRITRRGDKLEEENLGGCVFVKLIGRYGWREP